MVLRESRRKEFKFQWTSKEGVWEELGGKGDQNMDRTLKKLVESV